MVNSFRLRTAGIALHAQSRVSSNETAPGQADSRGGDAIRECEEHGRCRTAPTQIPAEVSPGSRSRDLRDRTANE
jgi:hypothetical protein